ncbi:uncharacterized protein LOC135098345 isoform X3 [Scylla paramamosain]|uniref:uncharacterized protein LOC135098345 isoform X3 n=1 Tax=Scylla paramamosain TaxID=85552 RepID=UPI0030830A42
MVRKQLLDMTEQKCHVYLGGIQTMHYRTFQDKMGLPGMLGTVVGDVKPFCGSRKIGLPGMLGTVVGDMKPFCGRKAFRLLRNDPRIFRETASNSMLNANTYTYDWWCIPHIWSSRSTPWSSPCTPICSDGSSWRVWRMWIYLPKNNLSTIPVDVVISEVSVRYQLAAQVSVVPAGWHLHFVSPGNQVCMCLVVYPENLKIQENSVTKNLQMNVIGWLMAAPQVNPEITGLIKYSMMGALEKLCLELKAAVTFRKEQSCNKSSKYFVKKVYVEGNLLHCSQENSGTHGCLQDPQRIGRHKFNLG